MYYEMLSEVWVLVMLCTAEDSLMFTRGKYVTVGVIDCSATRWRLLLLSG